MAYKQSPRSPLAKALKGNQHKLPQHLQDAIKAAPESPAKQTKSKGVRPEPKRQMGPLDNRNPHKPGTKESKKYIKDYNTQYYEAREGKKKAGMPAPGVSKVKSPAKKGSCGKY